MENQATPSPDASAIAANIAADAGESPSALTQAPIEPTSEQVEQPQESQVVEPTSQDPDPDFVRRFNALARRERELLQREQRIKEQYGEYENYKKDRETIKENPIKFLEQYGWPFKDLTDFVLNDQKKSPDQQVSELQKKINQLEEDRRKEKEEEEAREARKKAEETTSNFKKSIKETVSSNNEQFELINHYGEYDTVYDVIEKYYNSHGVILDVNKAAAEVEKYLEQQIEKAAATSKFKKKFSQVLESDVSTKKESEQLEPKMDQESSPRTLTNDSVASSAQPSQTEEYLSDEESKRRAAEFLREQLLKKQGYSKT